MNYDKPFKTFNELAIYLRDKHGLVVDNVNLVEDVLKFLPYYDLVNGYKDILMTNDKFNKPFKITDLVFLHSLDQTFQNSLLSFSISIEDYFKNILAAVIAKDFSVSEDEYLEDSHYIRKKSIGTGKTITRHFILHNLRTIAATAKDNPTFYYRKNHNHIPPWILLKNTSFSLSTNLFVLLPAEQKETVTNIMLPGDANWDMRYPVLLYILTMIRKCRNLIAHNLKFVSFNASRYMNNLNRTVLRSMIAPVLLTDDEIQNGLYLSGVYGYIILSLSVIPKGITHAFLLNRLQGALTMDGLFENPKFPSSLAPIRDIYISGVHLPNDVNSRLTTYFNDTYGL